MPDRAPIDITQLELGMMQNFCYVVADTISGEAIIIDPSAEPEKITRLVEKKQLRVIGVVNTHAHFDHIGANAAMIQRFGCDLMIHHEEAEILPIAHRFAAAFGLSIPPSPAPTRILNEGDTITVGSVDLTVLHTPGHSPGSVSLYYPGHCFTADALFVEGVGRTDLPGASWPVLERSIREKLFSLPDDTLVWPGHNYGPTPRSTIGHEKRHNPFLA